LPQQSSYFGFEYPDYLKRWINIKKVWPFFQRYFLLDEIIIQFYRCMSQQDVSVSSLLFNMLINWSK